MTDQELKKIADELSKRLWSGQHDLNGMKEEINFTLLKVQSQVRNTQSCSRNQRATQFCPQAEELAGKLAMLEANEAVQNALITDLKNRVEIAVDALSSCIEVLSKFDYEVGIDYGESDAEFKGQLSTDYFYSVKNRVKEALEKIKETT